MDKSNFNRRDFIKTSIKTVAISTIALSAFDLTSLIARASDKFEKGTSEKIIDLSDFPELQSTGGYAIVTKRVIVIRTSQSKFIALNLTCTHKHCEVDFDGTSFECPCHGSEYDKYGKVTNGPAKQNLKSYKTEFHSEDNTLSIFM